MINENCRWKDQAIDGSSKDNFHQLLINFQFSTESSPRHSKFLLSYLAEIANKDFHPRADSDRLRYRRLSFQFAATIRHDDHLEYRYPARPL